MPEDCSPWISLSWSMYTPEMTVACGGTTLEQRNKSKNQEQQQEITMHLSQPPVPPVASPKGLRAVLTDFEPGETGGKMFCLCLIVCSQYSNL